MSEINKQIKDTLSNFYKDAPVRKFTGNPEQVALGLAESYGVSALNGASSGLGATSLGTYNLAKFVIDRLKHLKVKDDLDARSYVEAFKAASGDYQSSIDFAQQQRQFFDNDTVDIREILYASERTVYPRYPDWLKSTGRVSDTRGLLIPVDDFDRSPITLERALQFQFNPTEIFDGKLVRYEERPYVGHDAIRNIWGGGGKRTLKFNLTFDATVITTREGDLPNDWMRLHYNSTEFGEYGKPRTTNKFQEENIDFISVTSEDGTLTPVSQLQSFKYSERVGDQRGVGLRFQNGLFEPTNRFSSPPTLYFLFGVMVFVVVVEDVQVSHKLFHKEGFPIRSECEVVLQVYEWDIPSNISQEAVSKLNQVRAIGTLPAQNFNSNPVTNTVA